MEDPNAKLNISIIVPLRNKADSIAATLENILEITDPDISVWIVDDYSEDASYRKAKNFKKEHNAVSFEVVKNPGPQGKISAIQHGIEHCRDSTHVLLLDADSLIDMRNLTLQELQAHMEKHDFDVLAFTVSPMKPESTIQRLQQIEYAITTNSLRGLIGVVTVVSGAGSFWRTRGLSKILKEHSRVFEGDDFEATILAYQKGLNIGFLRDVQIITHSPKDWSKLIWQRLMVWEIGFWRCLMKLILSTPKWLITNNSSVAAHYRGIIIIDLFMHPLKLLTFGLFIYHLSLFPVRLFETRLQELARTEGRLGFIYWIFLALGIISVNYWDGSE